MRRSCHDKTIELLLVKAIDDKIRTGTPRALSEAVQLKETLDRYIGTMVELDGRRLEQADRASVD
jgi:hypothetical protein